VPDFKPHSCSRRRAEALEQYQRILALAPDDAHTWIEMATAHSSLGNFNAAVQAYDHAFQLEPDWIAIDNINREYGAALIGNGQEQKAIAVFSASLEKADRRAGDGIFRHLESHHRQTHSFRRHPIPDLILHNSCRRFCKTVLPPNGTD
jgi:tetratricopeptide (TPR) repeat protein